jgi:hypothetical protein
MVQKIQDDLKTMTRRIANSSKVNIQKIDFSPYYEDRVEKTVKYTIKKNKKDWIEYQEDSVSNFIKKYSKYQVGDTLYVRETFAKCNCGECEVCKRGTGIIYKADIRAGSHTFFYTVDEDSGIKWKPSIFLPKDDARIFLEVTNVKLEYLQEISDADCMAEGITWYPPLGHNDPYDNYTKQEVFATLWDSLNKARGFGWNVNPPIFAYTLKKVKV